MSTTRLRHEGFSIGQAARCAGVKLETIRYYERIGMLADPPRTAAGHRVYGRDHVRTLAFIHRAREFEFALADIRALLAVRMTGPACCAGARDIALRHVKALRSKIADLSRLADLLEEATAHDSKQVRLCCPVMDLLDRFSDDFPFSETPTVSPPGRPPVGVIDARQS